MKNRLLRSIWVSWSMPFMNAISRPQLPLLSSGIVWFASALASVQFPFSQQCSSFTPVFYQRLTAENLKLFFLNDFMSSLFQIAFWRKIEIKNSPSEVNLGLRINAIHEFNLSSAISIVSFCAMQKPKFKSLGPVLLGVIAKQKKKHHQLKTILCGRCRLLSQGQMIPAVGGVGGYGDGKGYIAAEQLRAQLSHLRYQKALVVKLVSEPSNSSLLHILSLRSAS